MRFSNNEDNLYNRHSISTVTMVTLKDDSAVCATFPGSECSNVIEYLECSSDCPLVGECSLSLLHVQDCSGDKQQVFSCASHLSAILLESELDEDRLLLFSFSATADS